MVIELIEDDNVCMGERVIGVCYVTTFIMQGQVVGIALGVPISDGTIPQTGVTIHATPAGANVRSVLEATRPMVRANGNRALREFNP